jgi:phosphate transport system substrate-binding protein
LNSTQQAVSNAPVATNLPAGDQSWAKVSMLNSPGPTTYPIATFTYLLLPKDLSTNPNLDQTKAKALVDFISWAITDGQKLAANLGYVPLPAVVVKHNQDTLKSLTFKGTPLYTGQ